MSIAASVPKALRIVVGTKNPSKLSAVKIAVDKLFPLTSASNADSEQKLSHTIVGVDVPSGVDPQPKSAEETLTGAKNRAMAALKEVPDADYGIGLEGGLEQMAGLWMESGYVCVVRASDSKLGIGTSGRFQMADHIINRLVTKGGELAEIMDELSGTSDVRSSQGMMGLITNGTLPRNECYSHGVIFAFAPFVSPPQYWD